MKALPDPVFRIGNVRVAPALDEICKDGATIKLEPRTMRLLICLADHAGKVVSVEQLLDEVWKDVVVSPDSVYQGIAALRRILGDDPKEPSYIANVMRRGYRLVAPVSRWVDAPASEASPTDDTAVDVAPIEASRATVSPVATTRPRSPLRLASIAAFAVLTTAVAYFVIWQHWAPSRGPDGDAKTPPAPPIVSDKSIAVLAFMDMSEKKDQEYFSDGLSEELIDLLAQTPDLQVVAHTSSFYFKGKQVTIAEIAKTLRVANVLEGSVRKSGTKLRVTAQLIRADTGTHLWSKTYDRNVKDIFTVQDEVAAAVVDALKARLLPAMPLARAHHTDNSEAYDQFLIGKQAYNQDAYQLAVSAYRKAVVLDPNFGAAYAGLAESEADLADAVTGEPAGLTRGLAAAERAVALAPDQPDGYAARGEIRFTFFLDWDGGRADIEKAMAYGPGNISTQLRYSELLAELGLLPEAIVAARTATDADPLSGNAWKALGKWLTLDRQYAAARQALNRARQINPDSINPRWYLARVEILDGHPETAMALTQTLRDDGVQFITALAAHSMGRDAESQSALQRLITLYGPTGSSVIAEVYAWRGETNKAFEQLDLAYAQHDSVFPWIKTDPFLDSIRRDARYEALLRKMKLSE